LERLVAEELRLLRRAKRADALEQCVRQHHAKQQPLTFVPRAPSRFFRSSHCARVTPATSAPSSFEIAAAARTNGDNGCAMIRLTDYGGGCSVFLNDSLCASRSASARSAGHDFRHSTFGRAWSRYPSAIPHAISARVKVFP
jgi:hypothetical protein